MHRRRSIHLMLLITKHIEIETSASGVCEKGSSLTGRCAGTSQGCLYKEALGLLKRGSSLLTTGDEF